MLVIGEFPAVAVVDVCEVTVVVDGGDSGDFCLDLEPFLSYHDHMGFYAVLVASDLPTTVHFPPVGLGCYNQRID
eukprot:10576414-Ditylum_brightwellii.AAC.1